MTQVYLKKITLNKFRKITDMTINFKPGVNMIIGHNGTGKSNILSLLTSATGVGRSSLSPKYDNFFKIDETEDFKDYSVDNTYMDDESGTQFTHQLSFKDDSSEPGRVAHIVPRVIKTSLVDSRVRDAVQRWNEFFKINSQGSAKLPIPTKFISVSRIVPRGEGKLTTEHKNIGNESQFYKDWYNGIIRHSIKSDEVEAYEVKKPTDQKKTEMKIIDTPASGVSVGQDSLSTIITALVELYNESCNENYIGSILAIDEFDISLHADAQIKLLDKLIQLSDQLKIQIFVTTHSLSAVKYFSGKISRNPEKHTLTDIRDRLQPHADQSADFFEIAQSMYLKLNILPPKINLYTEDESGLRLLNLIMEAYPNEFKDFSERTFRLIPMKASKSILKYLNGNGSHDADDPHFHSSLIVYDGDARFSSHSTGEQNAANGEYILGNNIIENIPTETKVGQNAVILPSPFAPEAFIYHWLHKFVMGQDATTLDFWRHVTAQKVGIEREYYLDKFEFTSDEADIHNLKEHHIETLFDFAERSRLIEFIGQVESDDDEINDLQQEIIAFTKDFQRAQNHVVGMASAQSFEI